MTIHPRRLRFIVRTCVPLLLLLTTASAVSAQSGWTARLDGRVRFYQTTELGALVVGTERSLYAIDGATGEVLWRRAARNLDETDVAAVPGTDLLLVSSEDGERSRLEAVDLLGGGSLWRTDRRRGAIMGLAADTDAGLLAVTLVRDARDKPREGFRRKARIHVFDLANGRELWDRETGDIEMMPARWTEDGDVPYTLDNYRPPLFLDSRLFLFYEGVTSFDARTGEGREREKFNVNEDGLALTEADPAIDDERLYTSGRGRVRAVSRATGEELWRADDLGRTPELAVAESQLIVRTGGRFVRLKDGETTERGPYGVSALDPRTGKTLWRYKGADESMTNFALPDRETVLVADKDDLHVLDSATGKRRGKIKHRIADAAFLILNEQGACVVGGRNEIAAFDRTRGTELWRARHTPPGRGVLRTVTGIAARAAALYFRYGDATTTAFRGARLARAASSLRWSGLAARLGVQDLTTLAANRARANLTARLTSFGTASRLAGLRSNAAAIRSGVSAARAGIRDPLSQIPNVTSASLPSVDVRERLLDRLDPASQLERLSRFLLRRERLAALRGRHMYFYTDLRGESDTGGRGLAGVSVDTGRTDRVIRVRELDARFLVDEPSGVLYTADGDRLIAHAVGG